MVAQTVTATLSFSFSSSDSKSSSSVPQIRSGWTSSKSEVQPEYSQNPCWIWFHSYGESPLEMHLTGAGRLTSGDRSVESYEESISVSGSNRVQVSNKPLGPLIVTAEGTGLLKLEKTLIDNVERVTVVNFPLTWTFDETSNEIILSSNSSDELYGSLLVIYSTVKNLYKVDFTAVPCPEEAVTLVNADKTVSKEPSLSASNVDPSFNILAIFSNGVATASGSRNSQCCASKSIEATKSKMPSFAGGLPGRASSGSASGCSKTVHVYGIRPTDIRVVQGKASTTSDGTTKSERFLETLIFSGSNSAALQNPVSGSPRIISVSEFKGSGFKAIYDPSDTGLKNPKKGPFMSGFGAKAVTFDKTSNSMVIANDPYIVEAKYYGSCVVEYTSTRWDYEVEFDQGDCPEEEDTPEELKLKQEKSKAILLISYENGAISTLSLDRDASCCSRLKTQGYSVESHDVKVEAISVSESFSSKMYEAFAMQYSVKEYVLMNGYGRLDFEVLGMVIRPGIGALAGMNATQSLNLTSSKVFVSEEIIVRDTIELNSTAIGTLKIVPISPTWAESRKLEPDRGSMSKKGMAAGKLTVVFGSSVSSVYEGEYDFSKDTFRITGTRFLKPTEFAIVDRNNCLISCSGAIQVEYKMVFSIYEVNYYLQKDATTDPTRKVKYFFRYRSKGFNITGETESDVILHNKASKKEVKTLKDLLGQAQ